MNEKINTRLFCETTDSNNAMNKVIMYVMLPSMKPSFNIKTNISKKILAAPKISEKKNVIGKSSSNKFLPNNSFINNFLSK
jgi:hypothetical protein